MPAKPIQQADLILKLYELRRETVMREARSYIGGEFLPSSSAELVAIVSRLAAITGRLPRREADHRGLDSAIAVHAKCSTKDRSLIIRVSGHCQHSKHGVILTFLWAAHF